ncbi:MAG: hypothetical protein ACRDZ4_13020 [Egibacteraceae bacterium]
MLHLQRLAGEFFARLEKLDEMIAARVAAGRCRYCDGPLHQGNYQRKPRGGLIATAGEAFTRRHSLCCGRRGCRKRALPPSLRFLGRRVYLETVVVLASVLAQVMATAREAVAASGVPWRTLRRWGSWWREAFPRLRTWAELRAHFVPPPPDEALLPRSLFARLSAEVSRSAGAAEESAGPEVMLLSARYLAPVTTGSVVEGSRFVNAALAQMAAG